jgi:hypothetical protein
LIVFVQFRKGRKHVKERKGRKQLIEYQFHIYKNGIEIKDTAGGQLVNK